jgi:Flp pilus assembly protein TadG
MMKKLAAFFRRRRSGQTTLEFAIVALVFPVLMFGLMDLGYVVYSYATICSAAQEAVRYAVVHGPNSPSPASTAAIQDVAKTYAPGLAGSHLAVNVSWPNDANLPAQQDAQVQVVYQYPLQIPLIHTSTITLSTTYSMLASQ